MVLCFSQPSWSCHQLRSVPARLGKGQGAKEIGHSLARERPEFGHNLVRKPNKIGHILEHERPSPFMRERQKFGYNPVQHANETRSGHNFVGDR